MRQNSESFVQTINYTTKNKIIKFQKYEQSSISSCISIKGYSLQESHTCLITQLK